VLVDVLIVKSKL